MRLDLHATSRSVSLVAASSLVLLTLAALAACGSSSTPVPTGDASTSAPGDDDASDLGDAGTCGPVTDCHDFESSGDQLGGTYTAGSAGNALPPSFPAAPPGATLCGSVVYPSGDTMGSYLYYVYNGTAADLRGYYQPALAAAGDSLGTAMPAGVPSRPCDTFSSLQGADIAKFAQLYVYGTGEAFALGPFQAK